MTQTLLLQNARIVIPAGVIPRGWLACRDGKIAAFGLGEAPQMEGAQPIDARGLTLLPGFVDIHVHGGAGYEAMDATAEALRCMAQLYARHGVTAFLATTWTDSRERIQAALQAIAANVGAQPDGAALLGAHVEGPYLNPDRCGAQSTIHIRRAERDEALAFLETGVIRLLALAPEYPENHWLIRECAARGITVSAAHTAATYDDMRAAVELGVTQATHTYNAMTGLYHREPGTLGAALTLPQLRCELIADNIHVHSAAMKLVALAKGADGVILITDAMRGTGMPEGEYQIDERMVTLKDGAVRLPDGTLAGSALTMDRALSNYAAAAEQPIEAVWKASSLNPARSIGVSARKGSIEIGKDADLVLVDSDVNVYMTIAEGRIVFSEGL